MKNEEKISKKFTKGFKEKLTLSILAFVFFICFTILNGPDFEKTAYIKKEVTESGWKEHHFPGRYGGSLGKIAFFEINGKKYQGRMYPQFSNNWKNKDDVYLVAVGPLFFDVFMKVYACTNNQQKITLKYNCIYLDNAMNMRNDPMELFNE